MLKMYRIPHPWDYHRAGAIVVMAESKADAIAKAKRWYERKFGADDWTTAPEYDEATLVRSGVYRDFGCDC